MSRCRTIALGALSVCAASLPAVTAEAAPKRVFGARVLQEGMRGRDVRVLQDFLTRAGFSTAVDGQFGATTRRRVRSWEGGADLRVDGRVTRADARLLRSQAEKAALQTEPAVESPDYDPATGGATENDPQLQPAERARITSSGTVVAPASAPPEVSAFIAAANTIATKPYRYGGGHGRWNDSGYDCSGSLSYGLHGAGLLDTPLDSSGFTRWGDAGKGKWMTIYAHGGHAYMVVAGLRFDTSGRGASGSRWQSASRSVRGFTVRHPPGL